MTAEQLGFFGPAAPAPKKVPVIAHERTVTPKGAGPVRKRRAWLRGTVDVPRTGSIDGDFAAFTAANPHVFRALEKLALRYSRNGTVRVSMKFLYEALRQEGRISTNGVPFKLDNRFTSRFSRALIEAHPELADCFETRVLAGEK